MTGADAHQPEISVILPVFNGGPLLSESLDSLLEQTFGAFEVLAIDDGSTDDTPEILSAYAVRDARVRVLRHEANLGLIATLNEGLGLARGRFIARQDADDVSLPRRFALQRDALVSDPALGVVGSAYLRVRADASEVLRTPPLTHSELCWRLIFENVWCHSTIMMRAELVAGSRARYGDFLHAEDFELWGRLLQSTRGATVEEALVRYREHESAVSARNRDPQREMVDEVARLRMSELLERPVTLQSAVNAKACWQGYLGPKGSASAVETLLEMFTRFHERPDIDSSVVRELESRWIRRLVRRSGSDWARDEEGRRALRTIMKASPGSVALAVLTRLVRR